MVRPVDKHASVARLLGEAPGAARPAAVVRPGRAREALRHLEAYRKRMGEGEFRAAGEALDKARRALEEAGGEPPETTDRPSEPSRRTP
jgi:hypothetical protein